MTSYPPRTLLLDGWTVLRPLGSGELGVVVLAESTQGGGRRALKVTRNSQHDLVQRLVREADVLQSLDHPCLPRCDGTQRDELHTWAILEAIDGGSLAQAELSAEQGLAVVAHLADALAYCHDADVAHRDLKPDNVLLSADGPRLIDFSAALNAKAPRMTHASQNTPATPRYAPVEWFELGAVDDAFKGDVYSLGVLLFELLSGGAAFAGDWRALTENKLKGAGLDPGEPHDRTLRALVLNATQRNPERRPTMRNVAELLSPWLDVAVGAVPTPPLSTLRLPSLPARFHLEDELGQGSMGVVFRARDQRLGRHVAIKVLHPELARDAQRRARFEREGRTLARLDHPGIVEVYDVIVDDVSAALVMALADGGHAGDLPMPVPPERAWTLAAKVANALSHAHQRGVVHRDIKPENILLDASGEPRLTDFGLAALADDVRLTRTGEVLGTLAYMAPEQVRGEEAGPAADQHGLAAVIAQWLTGEAPHGDEAPGPTILHILYQDPILDGIVEPGRSVLAKAMSKLEGDRYPSVDAFAHDLRALAVGHLPSVRPPTMVQRALRLAKRHRRVVAAGAAMVAFVGVSGLALLPLLTSWQQQRAQELRLAQFERSLLDAPVASEADALAFLHDEANVSDSVRSRAWAAYARAQKVRGVDSLDSWVQSYVVSASVEEQRAALAGMSHEFFDQGQWGRLDGALAELNRLGHMPQELIDVERLAAAARWDLSEHPYADFFRHGTRLPKIEGALLEADLDGVPPTELLQATAEGIFAVERGTWKRGARLDSGEPCSDWPPRVTQPPDGGAVLFRWQRAEAGGPCVVMAMRWRDGRLVSDWSERAASGVSAAVAWTPSPGGPTTLLAGTTGTGRRLMVEVDGAVRDWPTSDVYTLHALDLNQDGTQELVLGSGPWNHLDISVFDDVGQGPEIIARRKMGELHSLPIRLRDGPGLVVTVRNAYSVGRGFPPGFERGIPRAVYLFSGVDLRHVVTLEAPPGTSLARAFDFDGDGYDEIFQRGLGIWTDTERGWQLWPMRDLVQRGQLDLDGDGDLELWLRRDGVEWAFGMGDQPAPRLAGVAPVEPSPPNAPAAWRRAEVLASLGLNAQAAEVLLVVEQRHPSFHRRAARRSTQLLHDDRAQAARRSMSAGEPEDLELALSLAFESVDLDLAEEIVQAMPSAIQTSDQPLELLDLGEPVPLVGTQLHPAVRVFDAHGLQRVEDGLLATVYGGETLLEVPLRYEGGGFEMQLSFTPTHLEFGGGVEVQLLAGDRVVSNTLVRGAGHKHKLDMYYQSDDMHGHRATSLWYLRLDEVRMEVSVWGVPENGWSLVSSDATVVRRTAAHHDEPLPDLPGAWTLRLVGRPALHGGPSSARVLLHDLSVRGLQVEETVGTSVQDLMARGELHRARSLVLESSPLGDKLVVLRGTMAAEHALNSMVTRDGVSALYREIRVGDTAMAMRLAGEDRYVRFHEAWGGALSSAPHDDQVERALIGELHGLEVQEPRHIEDREALVSLLTHRATALRAGGDLSGYRRDIRRAGELTSGLPASVVKRVGLEQAVVDVQDGDLQGALTRLRRLAALDTRDVPFLDLVRFHPELARLHDQPGWLALIEPAGPWGDLPPSSRPTYHLPERGSGR